MEQKLRDTVESKVNSSTGLCGECARYQATGEYPASLTFLNTTGWM